MEIAMRELLPEKGLIRPAEIRRQTEVLDSRTPQLGAKVVAKAWLDSAFRARLLQNGRTACEELGITFYDDTELIVLALIRERIFLNVGRGEFVGCQVVQFESQVV
jgi:nitrile hydratase